VSCAKLPTLLIVDDDIDTVSVTKMILERNGYQVHAFHHPEEALDHLEGCKDCEIVLSDIRMPKMTGIELAKHVKDHFPNLKFILMSSMPIRREEWRTILPFSNFVDDFINKPFSLAELVDVVTKIRKEKQSFKSHW
jgi:DNA-binding NtrC family response regulator